MRFTTLACAVLATIGLGVNRDSLAQAVRFESASAGAAMAKLAAKEFHQIRKGALAFVPGISGSGGALGKLCRNALDIAGTERPMLSEEIASCRKAEVEFVELPIALDAVVVVVNRRNAFVHDLTPSELRTIWQESAQAKIVRWNQVNAQFPDAPLKILGPDRQYEQASVFTEAILGRGKLPRRDYMASADDSILIRGVSRDVNTLAYVSYPTYLDHRDSLRAVPLVSDEGRAAVGRSAGRSDANSMLARPLFLYVNANSLEKPLVREFVEFTLLNGARIAKATRYQPLSAGAYKQGLVHLRNAVTGSAWNGSIPVGVTGAEVEKRLASR